MKQKMSDDELLTAELKKLDEQAKKSKKPNRFTHNRYRIFRVEVDPQTKAETKVTMKKFWAKSDDEAYDELKEYRKVANKEYTYYYGRAETTVDLDPKTKKVRYFDDLNEAHLAWIKEHDSIIEKISSEWRYICSKATDIKCWFRDVWHFIKTRHDYRECWQLDGHFINDLEFNLPLVKKFKRGIPIAFYAKAAKILHKADKKFDADEYLKKNPNLDEPGLQEAAQMIFNDELDKCIQYVKLYKYYSDYGIIDSSNADEVEFDRQWHKTLPYIPGTYKELDYKKLAALTDRNWNAIMNWCKDNLQYCWI